MAKEKDLERQNDGAEASSQKEKKSKKTEKKQPNRVVKWFKDLRSEFKKIVWPSKKTVVNNTFVVLVTMVVSAIFVGLLDAGFLKLLELALSGGSGS